MNTPKSFAEERAEKAKLYVKLKHAKQQRHFLNPEKLGPLPPALEQEEYMFSAGFTACLESQVVTRMAEALANFNCAATKHNMKHMPGVSCARCDALKAYEAAKGEK